MTLKPNLMDGSILGWVIPNDLILCGNTSSTFWKVTPMKNSSQFTPVFDYPFAHSVIGRSLCRRSIGWGHFLPPPPVNPPLAVIAFDERQPAIRIAIRSLGKLGPQPKMNVI